MSPTERVGGAALKAEFVVVEDGLGLTIDLTLAEKSALPAAALDNMLIMLCVYRTDAQDIILSSWKSGRQQHNSANSSVFGSVLGAGAGMNLQALVHTRLPNAHRTSHRTSTLMLVDHLMLGITWLARHSKQVRTMEWIKLLNLVFKDKK